MKKPPSDCLIANRPIGKLGRNLGEEVKQRARKELSLALYHGKVKKKPCAVCGHKITVGHHFDYRSPLEVIWLCRMHHGAVHREVTRSAEALYQERLKPEGWPASQFLDLIRLKGELSLVQAKQMMGFRGSLQELRAIGNNLDRHNHLIKTARDTYRPIRDSDYPLKEVKYRAAKPTPNED